MAEEAIEHISSLPQERLKVHFKDWLGVLAHVHTQVWPEFLLYLNSVNRKGGKEIEVLKRWSGKGGGKEGVTPLQFPISVLVEVAKGLGEKKGGFFVIDTPHPAHSLPEYHPELSPDKQPEKVREARRKLFSPEKLEGTIATISENLEVRRKAIEDARAREGLEGRIFTGVEADILDPSGRLDVPDGVLSRFDVVIASYHKGEWVDVNGKGPSYDENLNSYLAVSQSPFVDVIGHPKLPDEPLSPDQWKTWEEIFKNLASRGKAVEIPLSTLIGPDIEKRKRLFEFLRRAKKAGVRFFLNIDFHRLQDYFPDIIPSGGEGIHKIRQSQAAAARGELEGLSKLAESFPTSHKEVEKFEGDFKNKLSEIFKPGEGAFGLPRYLTTLARPFYFSIRQLQENGIEPGDVVNGDIKRFRDWLTQRKIYKEVLLEQSLSSIKYGKKNPF